VFHIEMLYFSEHCLYKRCCFLPFFLEELLEFLVFSFLLPEGKALAGSLTEAVCQFWAQFGDVLQGEWPFFFVDGACLWSCCRVAPHVIFVVVGGGLVEPFREQVCVCCSLLSCAQSWHVSWSTCFLIISFRRAGLAVGSVSMSSAACSVAVPWRYSRTCLETVQSPAWCL